MKKIIAGLQVLLFSTIFSVVSGQNSAENWPSFRGVNASGVSNSTTATSWDLKNKRDIKWQIPVAGLAHSSPIIWGDKLFLTTATTAQGNTEVKTGLFGDIQPVENETEHTWQLICFDKNSGKTLWRRTATSGMPKIKRHPKSTHANSTPATDGKHVVAFFGSEGLFCYDMQGNLLWQKDFGVLNATYYRAPKAQWGFGNSPIIHQSVVILQVDVLKNSFIGAYAVATGKELWRTPRSDVPTWCTPTIYQHDGATRIAANGYKEIAGYDFKTGRQIWTMGEGGDIPAPAPVLGGDLLFFTSVHGRLRPIYAVRTSAAGNISLQENAENNAAIAWSGRRNGAYMPTPIVIGDYLYRLQDRGKLACFELQTGELHWEQRLQAKDWFVASPVASRNAIYCIVESGNVFVVKPGPAFEILAQNSLADNCLATPAIVDGVIYFRTQHNLLAITE